MPQEIQDIPRFLDAVADLLMAMQESRRVLFRREMQDHLGKAFDEAFQQLRSLRERWVFVSEEYDAALRGAGLRDAQLALKMEQFEQPYLAFRAEGGQENLEDSLDTAGTVLGSLAGAIPGIGSLLQELIDVLLKELKRRLWRRKG